MDDAMIDLVAGDAVLRRRLEAFAEARLSPELAATTRMRARVLAVAHRQAALVRADAALAVVPPETAGSAPLSHEPADGLARSRTHGRVAPRRTGWSATRRVATLLLAACLGLGLAVGTTLAARPGAALYGARVWAETLTLPMAPRERAVAELVRLQARLAEATAAAAAGDTDGAAAALLAYESILGTASATAIDGGDAVALAALEVGVGHNIDVLTALLERVPPSARPALERVVAQAVSRSETAVRDIKARPAGPGGAGGAGGGGTGGGAGGGEDPGSGGKPVATDAATPTATATPTKTPKPDPTPRPTRTPRATEAPAPAATPAPTLDPTPRPTRTPRPVDEETRPAQPSPGRP